MSIEFDHLKNIIEAAILSSELPVTVDQMKSMLNDEVPDASEIERAVLELQSDYRDRGIALKVIDGGYRFHSREQYAPWLRKLFAVRPKRYSRALMETLSIIAFRQPVTRGDIESIRGVSVSTEIIRTLLSHDWITKVGYKQVPGRPALYGTTPNFLEYFSLESLADLPSLEDDNGDAQHLRDYDKIAELPFASADDPDSAE